MSVKHDPSERRSTARMPIESEVSFRTGAREQSVEVQGKTVNISSSGVLFTTTRGLTPGRRLEVAIDWPVDLDGKCALRLVARGRIVRCEGDRVALEILQHEFRTRSRARSMVSAAK